MDLRVIGAGFGRTGTASLAVALEQLGYSRVYHMSEVLVHPEHTPLWGAAQRGEADWQKLFAGYQAAVDWPACAFYKELLALNPHAKVVLTTRDADAWYDSARNTIYERHLQRNRMGQGGFASDIVVWEGTFDGRFDDKEHAVRVYNEHIAEVQRTVPADRLLMYDIKQGWSPLCTFLGKEVPSTAFPRVNDRAAFQENTRRFIEDDKNPFVSKPNSEAS